MHKGKKNMIDFWFVWIEKKVKLERNNIGVVWFRMNERREIRLKIEILFYSYITCSQIIIVFRMVTGQYKKYWKSKESSPIFI